MANLLELPVVRRTRRNHGLEHATIHVLSARWPGLSIAGRSTPYGFYLYGDVTAEDIDSAAGEALRRIRGGEHRLVVHPGCGTNYLTAGTFAGLAAFGALSFRTRNRWERLPNAIMAATAALIFSAPIGPLLQARVTTSADMGDLNIVSVRELPGRMTGHYVETHST